MISLEPSLFSSSPLFLLSSESAFDWHIDVRAMGLTGCDAGVGLGSNAGVGLEC